MDLFKVLEAKAKSKKRTIILPESFDKRVTEAQETILKKGTARLILIQTGKKLKVREHRDLDIIDIGFAKQFAPEYKKLISRKREITLDEAEKALSDPLLFACMLLKNNFADAVVAGSVYSTASVLRSSIQTIGLAKGNKTVSSFFLFHFPKGSEHHGKVFAYGDCGVLPDPTAEQLADITIQTSQNFKKLTGLTP
ncbi:MAG: hypothetical protein JNK43_01970, partial [Ignavibacteria bacterium]|nr:hypothetical protein [Ignavibacteria bacterium]